MQKPIRRLITLTIATVLAGLFGTAAGFAAVIAGTGGPLLRIDTRSSTADAETGSTSFVNLPGAQVRIIIPTTGGARLVVARFSAESICDDAVAGNSCFVRIIAFNAGTSMTTEMHPQSGTDFVFDTVSGDGFEAHSLERSLRWIPAPISSGFSGPSQH